MKQAVWKRVPIAEFPKRATGLAAELELKHRHMEKGNPEYGRLTWEGKAKFSNGLASMYFSDPRLLEIYAQPNLAYAVRAEQIAKYLEGTMGKNEALETLRKINRHLTRMVKYKVEGKLVDNEIGAPPL